MRRSFRGAGSCNARWRRSIRHLVVPCGHAAQAVRAACNALQRHAGAGLRARRRAPRRRPACRRGRAPRADCDRRIEARDDGRRIPGIRRCGLRGRPAGGAVHGPRAHCARVALGRHAWRVFRQLQALLGASDRRRPHGASARHRRHAIVRPDGRTVRCDGEAVARRPRFAIGSLWRVARASGIHGNRRCVRKSLRRILHDVFPLAGPLRPVAADRGFRADVADDGHRAEVLFLCREQPHLARCAARPAGPGGDLALRTSSASSCTGRTSPSSTSGGRTSRRVSRRPR